MPRYGALTQSGVADERRSKDLDASTCEFPLSANICFSASCRRSLSAAISSSRTYRRYNARLRRRAFSLWACFPTAQLCVSIEYLRPRRPAAFAIPSHWIRKWYRWGREMIIEKVAENTRVYCSSGCYCKRFTRTAQRGILHFFSKSNIFATKRATRTWKVVFES